MENKLETDLLVIKVLEDHNWDIKELARKIIELENMVSQLADYKEELEKETEDEVIMANRRKVQSN